MAEFRKLPTQAELQNMLFMEQMRVKNPQQIAQEALASGTTVSPIPENVFQKIAGGAGIAKEYVNRAGSAADLAKLFPGYKPETRVNIPTGYNFAPKQAPTGEVIPGGLQTQNVNLGQVLGAIKPADVLGISGAERAYSDIGAGKAPQPLDVLDVAGLGATGLVGGKAALRATKGVPVGMSIQEAKGLLTEAPRSPLGFYSALEESALNLQRNKGSGQAFLNDLQKAPNVKADEIKWTGLDEFLKTKPNVTKQEVQDYLANNRVEVQEVQLGAGTVKSFEQWAADQGLTPEAIRAYEPSLRNSYEAFKNSASQKVGAAKFGQYTLPGGENYREILLTMPSKKAPAGWTAKDQGGGMWVVFDETGSQRGSVYDARNATEAIAQKASETSGGQYVSTHFPDQRNILAHLRVNDRVDADGKKMLLVEEVQSDWHQAGREKGYGRKPSTFVLFNQKTGGEVGNFATREEAAEFMKTSPRADEFAQGSFVVAEKQGGKGVPDAPFKDSWYQLALKRAIQYAAENGYDRIGLTTGSQQAARFDLSKQISELHYSGTNLVAYDKAGNQVIQQTGVAEADLPGLIGKEAAKKLMEQPKQGTLRSLVGQELQVGGEGMKKYYDEIYPKFLDKYGKKWGARVGETSLGGTGAAFDYYKSGNMFDVIDGNNNVVGRFNSAQEAAKQVDKLNAEGTETVRYLDVTPEMKASVSKGQPLFQAIPAIPATGLLATQDENK